MIHDSKGESGIVGLTRMRALLRWTLTRHMMGQYTAIMHQHSRLVQTTSEIFEIHEQTRPAMIIQDEADAQNRVKHISQNMTNPFNASQHPNDSIINISTLCLCVFASDGIKGLLIIAGDTGWKQAETFIMSRLSKTHPKSF